MLTFLLAFALIFTIFSLTAVAYDQTANEPVFYDDGFLSTSERESVRRTLEDAQEKTGLHFGVLLYEGKSDGGLYHDRMKDEDSVLLLITREGGIYYYEMFAYGEAYDVLHRKADAILDNDDVYDNIKGGNFVKGITAFVNLTTDAYLPDPNAEAKHTVRTVLISLLLAAICAGAAAGAVVYHYKKKLKAPIYPLDRFAKMKLVDQGDTFITSHVTRVRVSSPSNSSGGGRSGGGGGGGGGGSLGKR
ncbi:MAG TPA: hypothetical protein DDY70_00250 [Clostridiales bacterium]|nr:hypothetical protein [Clostridiales bacterium]